MKLCVWEVVNPFIFVMNCGTTTSRAAALRESVLALE